MQKCGGLPDNYYVITASILGAFYAHTEKKKKRGRETEKNEPVTVPDNGGQRRRMYWCIRKLHDISLHRNRDIIDREVCSTRQIDGRGENDDRVETREDERQQWSRLWNNDRLEEI